MRKRVESWEEASDSKEGLGAVERVEGVGAVEREDGERWILGEKACQQVEEELRAVGGTDSELEGLEDRGDGSAEVSEQAGGNEAIQRLSDRDRPNSAVRFRNDEAARARGNRRTSEMRAGGEVDDVGEEIDGEVGAKQLFQVKICAARATSSFAYL